MSKQEAGRARLLAAARKAATETAAYRVSLRDIAKAAGLSPAACYRYFESRERLADALAVEVCGEIETAIRQAVAQETGISEQLAAAARAYLGYAVANRGAFDLSFERAAGDWVAPERCEAGMRLGNVFGDIAGRADLGICIWAAVHGLVDLLIKGTIDIGQRDLGASVLASRGDTVIRGLIGSLVVE